MRVDVWVVGGWPDDKQQESELDFEKREPVEMLTIPCVGDLVEWSTKTKDGAALFWAGRVVGRTFVLPSSRSALDVVRYRVAVRVVDTPDDDLKTWLT